MGFVGCTMWLPIGLCIAILDVSPSQASGSAFDTLWPLLPLKVQVFSESATVAVREPLRITGVTVTNLSDHAIRLPTNLGGCLLVASIEPNGERPVYLQGFREDFAGTLDETVLLPPRSWFGTTLSNQVPLTKPGDWIIWWDLYVPRGRIDVPMEGGRATSESTVVRVTR